MELALQRAYGFVLRHDDLPAFHAAYLAITFVAAALLTTGAFAVLVAAHMALDIVKYREIHHFSWRATAAATFRESLLDLFFLGMALTLSVYLHHATGVVAVGGLIRSEEIILRAIGTVLPRMGVLCNFLWIMSTLREHMLLVQKGIAGRWRRSEILCLLGVGACALLIVAAPFILEDREAVLRILLREMIPWRV